MTQEPPEQAFVSALTTEHLASQTARSAVITELVGRAMLYMGAVSSALITFGFVAQAGDLTPFIATVLPGLVVLGEFTFVAMVRNSRNRQELWVGFVDHAATLFGFSMSTPFLKVAPARTSAARCGPFMARQRSCAAMMSL